MHNETTLQDQNDETPYSCLATTEIFHKTDQ